MLYEQYFIDDLKDRADLVRIIERFAFAPDNQGDNGASIAEMKS